MDFLFEMIPIVAIYNFKFYKVKSRISNEEDQSLPPKIKILIVFLLTDFTTKFLSKDNGQQMICLSNI